AKDIWRSRADRSTVAVMGTNAVLLAEHEPGSREYLERHLRDDGFTVFEAAWTSRALDLVERLSPDVVIAGEADLCRRLRAGEPGRTWNKNVPVIVLTEPGADPIVRVRALESGADDVVPRDVYLELLARVRALLRRAVLGQADLVEAGPLVVDHRARQVRVGEVAVRLSGREFELAAKLASEPRRVFTKTELLRDVWGIRAAGIRTRTVDSHASRLRRKLEAAGAGDVVVNDWGVGYRLLA
ncbi:MAG TPA: response regulator transcription factor, partial [Gaiella sp.]|nr:response regulator transcription factor [Gaiella sp.]